jgi:hypothetical protein
LQARVGVPEERVSGRGAWLDCTDRSAAAEDRIIYDQRRKSPPLQDVSNSAVSAREEATTPLSQKQLPHNDMDLKKITLCFINHEFFVRVLWTPEKEFSLIIQNRIQSSLSSV